MTFSKRIFRSASKKGGDVQEIERLYQKRMLMIYIGMFFH